MIKRFDFPGFVDEKVAWSQKTFGDQTAAGVLAHVKKELKELEENPGDLVEWIDLILLAIDGACRVPDGPRATGHGIAAALEAKMRKNRARKWPEAGTMRPDEPREHDRTGEAGTGQCPRHGLGISVGLPCPLCRYDGVHVATSPITCGHANETVTVCPCADGCYCRGRTCAFPF